MFGDMMDLVFFVLILVLYNISALRGLPDYELVDGFYTYKDADSRCRDLGEHWEVARDTSTETHFYMEQILKNNIKINSLWLPLHRATYDKLTVVGNDNLTVPAENQPARGDMDPAARDTNCGALRWKPGTLAYTKCTADHGSHLFVCQINDKCPQNTWPDSCFDISSDQTVKSLLFQQNKPSWYYARSWCRQHGGDLAVPSQTTISAIQRSGLPSLQIGESLWMGMRTSDWKYPDNTDVNAVFWDSGEPHYEGDCVILETAAFKIAFALWKTAECNQKHSVLCQKKNAVLSTTAASVSSTLPEEDRKGTDGPQRIVMAGSHFNSTTIVFLVLFLLLLALVVFLAFVIACQRERINELSGEESKNTVFSKLWKTRQSTSRPPTESDNLYQS